MAKTSTPILSFGLFVFFSFAYLWARPSLAYQSWDSLAYARSCELKGAIWMIGNHPLGHLAECGVFSLAQRLGYTGRALSVLQICNAVTGAAAVAVFLVLLTTVLSVGRVRAVGWSVVLGAAYGCWYQAGVADIYSISMLLLVLAWASIVRYLTQPSHARDGVLAGILTGLAILMHQFNGVLLTAGVIGLMPFVMGRRTGRSLPLALGIGLSGAAVTVVIGYALLGALSLGAWSPADIIAWVTGYGTSNRYGPRSLTLAGVKRAAYTLGETLLAPVDETGPLRFLSLSVFGTCLVLLIVGLSAVRRLPDQLRAMIVACGLQCAAGWCLTILWWSAINVGHGAIVDKWHVGKWWMLTLPALLCGCACALEGLVHKARDSWRRPSWHRLLTIMPLLLAAWLLVFNASALLRLRAPYRPLEQVLHDWVIHSGPDDVLILNWEVFHPHLHYWEERAGVVDFYDSLANKDAADRFASLRAVIEQAVQQHHAVLAVPYSDYYYSNERMRRFGLTAEDARHFFDQYSWQGPVFSYQAGVHGPLQHVYHLTSLHGERRR